MPQRAPTESSADAFAGLLASLAAPSKPSPSTWDDELADDIATINYEQALRTHAQHEPPATELPSAVPEIATASSGSHSGSGKTSPCKERLKTASITIRLSEPECAQLRQRAAEAGLTMSAYLRSCILEVEGLRAQVKETLAQIRQSGSTPSTPIAPKPPHASALGIWNRLWLFSGRK